MKRILLILFLIFAGSCVQPELQIRAPLVDDGEVYLYLQPVPEAYQQLRFTIADISANRDDGTKVPLQLSLTEFNGAALIGRQKLLAAGTLPPGPYTGVSVRIASAAVRGKDGDAALFPPPDPFRTAAAFEVVRKKATLLFLSLEPSSAFTSGVRLTPVFSLGRPRPPLLDLIGYVSCAESNIVSIFNKKTMQVTGVLATGSRPKGLALDRRRRRLYVAVSGEDAVIVVDVLAGEITNRVSLRIGDEPTELALTPDGRTLVAVNTASNTVSIIDAVSLIETHRIKVGDRPTSAAIPPVASRAFVTNAISNTVSVVDLNRRALLTSLPVGSTPLKAGFSPRGERLYVINRDSPDMSVISPASLTARENIFTGMGAVSIAVSAQTGMIYVGKRFGNEVSIIAPQSLMFIDRIGILGDAVHLEIDDQENSLFVVLPDRNVLQKVNITAKRVVSEIEVGEGAYAAVVMGKR